MANLNARGIVTPPELRRTLSQLGLRLDMGEPSEFTDGVVLVPTLDGDRALPLVMSAIDRLSLTPADFSLLEKAHPEGLLAVEPRIPPDRSKEYRDRGIAHLDLDGNGWIDLPGFRLWIEGRPRRSRPTRAESHRGRKGPFTPAGIRLMFPLLVNPELASSPIRELAHLAMISVGSASEAMQALTREGHVVERQGERHLENPAGLSIRWVEGFRTRLLPTLRTRQLAGAPASRILRELERSETPAVTAGEFASVFVRRPQTLVAYSVHPPTRLVASLGLRKARDESPTLLWRDQFWHPDLLAEGRAPEILNAAELLSSDDPRLQEAGRVALAEIGGRLR